MKKRLIAAGVWLAEKGWDFDAWNEWRGESRTVHLLALDVRVVDEYARLRLGLLGLHVSVTKYARGRV